MHSQPLPRRELFRRGAYAAGAAVLGGIFSGCQSRHGSGITAPEGYITLGAKEYSGGRMTIFISESPQKGSWGDNSRPVKTVAISNDGTRHDGYFTMRFSSKFDFFPADFDNDGVPEIIIEEDDGRGPNVSTLKVQADGHYTYYHAVGWGYLASVRDLNGDGSPEVILLPARVNSTLGYYWYSRLAAYSFNGTDFLENKKFAGDVQNILRTVRTAGSSIEARREIEQDQASLDTELAKITRLAAISEIGMAPYLMFWINNSSGQYETNPGVVLRNLSPSGILDFLAAQRDFAMKQEPKQWGRPGTAYIDGRPVHYYVIRKYEGLNWQSGQAINPDNKVAIIAEQEEMDRIREANRRIGEKATTFLGEVDRSATRALSPSRPASQTDSEVIKGSQAIDQFNRQMTRSFSNELNKAAQGADQFLKAFRK